MHYISKEGIEQLKKELAELKEKRKEIANRLEEAKALGDLSENVEYSEARDAQAFNEGKILELSQLLKEAVEINQFKKDIVQVGAKIKVKSENGAREFMIVGSEEADPSVGKISNVSPLGQAFLGHRAGDSVDVETPRGIVKYKILELE